jgi:superfamily II DNA or RNA helicase
MGKLANLRLNQAYHKPEDDIARGFYLPCLAAAQYYDRAVGFFSSAIYALAWPSLRQFVDQGGKMRLICSPVLSVDDTNALREGYTARRDAVQGELLKSEFVRMLAAQGTVKPAKVLASLVAIGIVDFRIAWVGEVAGGHPKRLFHDKVGIFRDQDGDAVAFKGSMNETWPGLALDGNLESVDVFLSWAGDREKARVDKEREYFDRLWTNTFPGVVTVALPEVARNELIAASDPEHWRELVEEICIELGSTADWTKAARFDGKILMPHQATALDAWRERDRRGIFAHATGAGKTFTALCAINDAFSRGETVLVVVPSDLLLQSWAAEMRTAFDPQGLRLLVCGGGHSDWRTEERLRKWTRVATGAPRAVLATIQTASTRDFIEACKGGSHLFIVADEVHRLGARNARNIFSLETGPRLGLSATPQRAGDPDGTRAIFAYFNGVVPPPFTLFDAIKAGTLTQYAYHVHRISLEPDEQEKWHKLTKEISRLAARAKNNRNISEEMGDRLKHLLIRRAHILKSAKQKVSAALKVIKDNYQQGQHWIVYCDDQSQLAQVRNALISAGCPDVLEYHTAMTGDSRQTLELFAARGGVIVSIRCLDEGVNIPAVSHALILASSKNPREYVQRRGRVLRKYPGKALSHIHDIVVTPLFDPDEPPTTAILQGELSRAIEFGAHALNPGCVTDLERLAIEHGIQWDQITGEGFEDEDDALQSTIHEDSHDIED